VFITNLSGAAATTVKFALVVLLLAVVGVVGLNENVRELFSLEEFVTRFKNVAFPFEAV
jgi:hypothetical protein